MLIGYARVSTGDQRLTLHIDALEHGQEELILRPDDYELVARSSLYAILESNLIDINSHSELNSRSIQA